MARRKNRNNKRRSAENNQTISLHSYWTPGLDSLDDDEEEEEQEVADEENDDVIVCVADVDIDVGMVCGDGADLLLTNSF